MALLPTISLFAYIEAVREMRLHSQNGASAAICLYKRDASKANGSISY